MLSDKIWLKSYETGVPAEINPDTYTSLDLLFQDAVKKYQNAVAFRHEGVSLTYNQMAKNVQIFSAFLQQQWGLQKGDRVAIMLPNCLQYPIAFYAILRAGLVVVNVNPLYTATELAYTVKDAGAKAIIVLENFAHVVEEAWAQTNLAHVCVTGLGDMLAIKGRLMNGVIRHVKKMVPPWRLPGHMIFREAMATKHTLKSVSLHGEDIALLQYTGGTTGRSKGAILTHRNLVANALQAAAWVCGSTACEKLTSAGGIVTALPLYHIFSLLANCVTFFHLGIYNILITNPRDIPKLIDTLRKERVVAMTGVNTLFNAMMNHPKFKEIDFSNFYMALGGGAAVQRVVADRWRAMTNTPLLEAYGLTEASPAVCINPLDLMEFNGSIGLPICSTQVRIMDSDGNICANQQPGELCVRGPQVMRGYWKQPEETALVLKDGWLHTGDLAFLDTKGFVHIVDRIKDVILISGFKVFPNEVEGVLAQHPGVLEAVVVGVPNEHSGESAKAYVVLKDLQVTSADLIAHCRKQLTSYKVPKDIEFRKDLPKTNVGKILRRVLREEAREKNF